MVMRDASRYVMHIFGQSNPTELHGLRYIFSKIYISRQALFLYNLGVFQSFCKYLQKEICISKISSISFEWNHYDNEHVNIS